MIKHEILPDGRLRLFADEETRAALKEVQLENGLIHNGHLSFSVDDETEFMEHLIANSELCWLYESDLPGDMTSAPALGLLGEECDELDLPTARFGELGVARIEHGVRCCPIIARWRHMNYALRSFLEELMEKGESI